MSPSWKPIPVRTLPNERFLPPAKGMSLRARVKILNSLLGDALREHEATMSNAEELYRNALFDLKLVKELAKKQRDGVALSEDELKTLGELLADKEEPIGPKEV